MRELLSITLPTGGSYAILRRATLMVGGSLLAACGDDNQLPFATADALPTTEIMTEKSRQEYNADDYFRDPDEDPLFFTASVDDAAVATAVVEELDESPTLVIEGVAGGETMVTLTATDPDGGEAKISGNVLVVEPVLFWRDDFESYTDEWSFGGTYSYGRQPGSLAGVSGHFFARRKEADNAKDWLVSVSVAAEFNTNNQTVGFWSYAPNGSPKRWLWATVGHADTYVYVHDAVTPSNWQVVWCCGPGYTWGAGGVSDAVNPLGEYTEMHWGVRLGEMEFFIGETLVWSQDATEGDWPTVHVGSALFSYPGENEAQQWVYFDWAELWGIPADDGEGGLSADWQSLEGSEPLNIAPATAFASSRMVRVAR